MNSVLSIYHREKDIVSLHMFDRDTGEYNVPYIKNFLLSCSCILIYLVTCKAGFYV
ncbi:substrate-binding domain-containing protein [Peribacillus sp. B-H-3]|uniref:substrate-binding domain-containing protein n=1 Tax=Peribacillus sp. B-H-3 TaxID=3400420 RepID=UPI003B024FA4